MSSHRTGCGLLWARLPSMGHFPQAGVSPTWPASLLSVACLGPEGIWVGCSDSPRPSLWRDRNQGTDGDRLAKVIERAEANPWPGSFYLLLPSRHSDGTALWWPPWVLLSVGVSSGGSTRGLQGTRDRGRRTAGGLLMRGPSPSPHCTVPAIAGPPCARLSVAHHAVWQRPASGCTATTGRG